jgi:integral membrane protein
LAAGRRPAVQDNRGNNRGGRTVRADTLVTAVRRYRVMAYVTGVVLMFLCFVGIPLQVFAHNLVVVNYVGTTHGILYMIYLVTAYLMTRQVGLKLASPSTLIVLLAGTIPVLTFVVERWVTRRYINPALAAAGVPAEGWAAQPAPEQPAVAPSAQQRPS